MAREENVMHARDRIAEVIELWPDSLPPQSILLLAARLLSAVIRGCDTINSNYMRFDRDLLMENDIVTAYLRHFGLESCKTLFNKIRTRNLMHGSPSRE